MVEYNTRLSEDIKKLIDNEINRQGGLGLIVDEADGTLIGHDPSTDTPIHLDYLQILSREEQYSD